MSTTVEDKPKNIVAVPELKVSRRNFNELTSEKIKELEDKYLPLTCKGADDDAGYNLVHPAWQEMKKLRLSVEETRKALKQPALDYGRKVDAVAKQITAELKPIEDHLKSQYDVYQEEKKRIKAEKEAAERARVQEIVNKFAEVGSVVDPREVGLWSEEYVQQKFSEAEAAFLERQEAARIEKERQEAEAKRLAEERAAMEAEKAKLEEEKRAAQEEFQRQEAELAKAKEQAEAARKELEAIEQEKRDRIEADQNAVPESSEHVDAELAEVDDVVQEAAQSLPGSIVESEYVAVEEPIKAEYRDSKLKLLQWLDTLDSEEAPEVQAGLPSDVAMKLESMLAECVGEMRDMLARVL
ncbi:hypothetical protein KOR42_23130 [Thalassoglobus neptunius]|uniref:Uncharacterized protein n=1 Tax=Thalassoglobus neptunius TaxID=1938619 RepID=A0A5C5X7A8_9PLAN|nr:hypothetical protein [Thalassoglobus neptunius]TWT58926.1 hypothetical protein KOR42_23130 [Thalassoglobus neptunius]